jgi:ribosomal protein S18 acetylase RimI-like enzyme
MSLSIRPANDGDADFIAWVIQEAARSHLPKGLWDMVFPGPDDERLALLAKIATSDRRHFGHCALFRILEEDGRPAAAMCGYEHGEHGFEQLTLAMASVLVEQGWQPAQLVEMGERTKSFSATGYVNPDGLWIIEWVATVPEQRGRGLVRKLMLEVLEEGRQRGFTRAQIGYLLGNVRAKSAYEGVGFQWLEDHCHPTFEADYGAPGLARMQRDL